MSTGIIAAGFVSGAGGGANYSSTLTVPAGKVASTLTGFVTRVSLASMPAAWWDGIAPQGRNIRVQQGGVDVPFDLALIDTAARTGRLFFKSTLQPSVDNVFQIKTVAGALSPAATDPNGRNAVWSAYAAMFVFSSGSVINRVDGSMPTLMGSTAPPLSVDGADFNASGGSAYSLTFPAALTQFTMGTSIIQASNPGNGGIMSMTASANSAGGRTTMVASYNQVKYANWNGGYLNDPGTYPILGSRIRLHNVSDTATRSVWRNGILAASGSQATQTKICVNVGTSAGAGGEWFKGKIDYTYVYKGILGTDWLAAEYTSWESPTTFYTVT